LKIDEYTLIDNVAGPDGNCSAWWYSVYEAHPTDFIATILFGPEVFQGASSFTLNDFNITRAY